MSFRRARQRAYKVGLQQTFGKRSRVRFSRFGGRRFGLGLGGRSRLGAGRVRARTYMALNQRTGGLLGIEKKFLDIARTSATIAAPTDATGGAIAPSSIVTGCYSAPAQGDGPTNRDGNKIVIVETNFIGAITCAAQADQTAADVTTFVFICIVQDMQTNGAVLTSESVWTNPTASASTAATPFRNMSFTSRFKILAMKKIKLPMPTLTYDGTNIEQTGFHVPFQLKWKGKIPVTFTTASTTADIANVTDNSIQFIAFTTNQTLAPQIAFNCRTRFYG